VQAPPVEIAQLLQGWRDGDQETLDALQPLVYGELRRRAHFRLRKAGPDHTLRAQP